MTYISAQPKVTNSWDEICYPVRPVWLAELLPDYDIIATDRQQLVVGQIPGGRKTIFGIQSADYTIIPNAAIQEVVDRLIPAYTLSINYTTTGEFSINIVLPDTWTVGGESLQRSIILTNSYNGKTPFTLQGQSLAALLDPSTLSSSSAYRALCQNGLVGWADQFDDLANYQSWLLEGLGKGDSGRSKQGRLAKSRPTGPAPAIRTIHQSGLTVEGFQQQLEQLLIDHLAIKPALTTTVYNHFQQTEIANANEKLLRTLPIPVQLAKQAQERLRLEERLLNAQSSYWLVYNAVNYALFTSRSSLTLNDRYRLDERVFHQLAAQAYA